MQKKHFFLIATQVLYLRDNLERTRNFNVLIANEEEDVITRAMLGRVQQQAQMRFFTEFDQGKTSQIRDVFIMATNRLGYMTDAEFHEGFDIPGVNASSEAQQEGEGEPTPPVQNEAPVADNDAETKE